MNLRIPEDAPERSLASQYSKLSGLSQALSSPEHYLLVVCTTRLTEVTETWVCDNYRVLSLIGLLSKELAFGTEKGIGLCWDKRCFDAFSLFDAGSSPGAAKFVITWVTSFEKKASTRC